MVSNLLGLLFGEMVTNLLIIPGDCCIGGVRHILSSFSVLGVISSPTRILSRLPSSTPFPNHRPQGNLHDNDTEVNLLTTITSQRCWVNFPRQIFLLVRVSRDLVADHNTLHKPLSVEPRVIMAYLHCGEFAQVLALREEGTIIKHPN